MSHPIDKNEWQAVDRTAIDGQDIDGSEALGRRPYGSPQLQIFKLADVVRGGSQGNFDNSTQGPGLPPDP